MPRYCIYCNSLISREQKSMEHVIPQWILEFLKSRNTLLPLIQIREQGRRIDKRNLTANKLVHQICKSCNHGWLSDIDASCMGFTKKLLTAPNDLTKVEIENEKTKFLKLAYKISLNFIATSNFANTHKSLFENFYCEREVPTRIDFFGCRIRKEQFHKPNQSVLICHSNIWKSYVNDTLNNTEAFKIFLTLGKISIVILKSNTNNDKIYYNTDILIPITHFNNLIHDGGIPFPDELPKIVPDNIPNQVLFSICM